MSDTDRPTPRGASPETGQPRAVIHKHILDVAETRPAASLEEIAGAVSGASIQLVERVLQEYGDPCDPEGAAADDGPSASTPSSTDGGETGPAPDDGPDGSATDGGDDEVITYMKQNGTVTGTVDIDEADLTDKQRETVHAIRADPDASQADLADRLGVSRATICQRVNSIDGFDWAEREQFVEALLANGDGGGVDRGGSPADLREDLDALADRIETLERRLDQRDDGTPPALGDPALAHKVVHACVRSDRITEDEELALIRGLIGDDGT